MTIALPVRRALTVVGVVAALALGLGSIEAAAAWAAASAPLTVAPVTVSSLQARLATEQTRSQALLDRLEALDGRSRDLSAALTTANDRIVADQQSTDALEQQLATAKGKLAKLEHAIAKAKRDLARRQAAARAATAAPPPTARPTRAAHEGDDGEHDDGEHDDG
jgi:DNA repair exonuclease SbcCD ATPase subunit